MAITDVEVIQRARTLIQDDAYGVHPAPRRYSDEQMQGFLRQTLSHMVQLRPDIFTVTCLFHFRKGRRYVGQYSEEYTSTEQRLPPPAVRLVELLYRPRFILQIEGAVFARSVVFEEVDWDTYVRAAPMWVEGTRGYATRLTSGAATDFATIRACYVRHPRNPRSFFIWPAIELEATYLDAVVSPHPLAAFDDSAPQKIYVAKCEDFSDGAQSGVNGLSLGGPDVRPEVDVVDEAKIDEYYLLPDAYLGALVDGVVYFAESVDNEHVNSGRAKLFYDSFLQSLGIETQNREQTDVSDAGVRVPKPGVAAGGTQ